MTSNSSVHQGISAEHYRGMTILRSTEQKPFRRVLYLNSYGMARAWRDFREGLHPGQHLWGCLELVRMGYEIAMPEELTQKSRFFNYRRQDLKHLSFAVSWLGRDGIVYSGHTILFWTPLLVRLKLLRRHVVTMLYARGENLRFPNGYRGILALTPAAADRARRLAPNARVAHIRWGVDLPFFPVQPYSPQWFLSCGKTRRDFVTLQAAAAAQPAERHCLARQRAAIYRRRWRRLAHGVLQKFDSRPLWRLRRLADPVGGRFRRTLRRWVHPVARGHGSGPSGYSDPDRSFGQ